jgi:RNA polymerase sigma-70 factor, ECF subfamily
VDASLAMEEGLRPEDPLEARLVAEMPALRRFSERLLARGAAGPGASCRESADDLVQEVLHRALRYRHAFDRERALAPWLRRTALRVFLDTRARTAPQELGATVPELAAPARDELEQREQVAHMLAPLAPVERDVLLRFHRRGESVREIAAELELAEGTVKSHLHRARRKLASRVHEGGPT